MSRTKTNADNVKNVHRFYSIDFHCCLSTLVDDVFETESRRLLTASERISDSISRVAFTADRVRTNAKENGSNEEKKTTTTFFI